MLSLWLGVSALIASPQLHRLLHDDAQSPAHACLVTQLQGGLETGFVPFVAPAPVLAPIVSIGPVEVLFIPAGDPSISPSRGPPSVSFFRVA
jgi:hypothetical protein